MPGGTRGVNVTEPGRSPRSAIGLVVPNAIDPESGNPGVRELGDVFFSQVLYDIGFQQWSKAMVQTLGPVPTDANCLPTESSFPGLHPPRLRVAPASENRVQTPVHENVLPMSEKRADGLSGSD